MTFFADEFTRRPRPRSKPHNGPQLAASTLESDSGLTPQGRTLTHAPIRNSWEKRVAPRAPRLVILEWIPCSGFLSARPFSNLTATLTATALDTGGQERKKRIVSRREAVHFNTQ